MNAWEIVILICAIALVVFTIIFNVVRRIKGKGSPCCSCGRSSDCAYCAHKNGKKNK